MGLGHHLPPAYPMNLDDSLSRSSMTVGRTLALGVLRGLWTLENLDHPPRVPQDPRSINIRPKEPFRNLAREWIAANPREWEIMQRDALEAEAINLHHT